MGVMKSLISLPKQTKSWFFCAPALIVILVVVVYPLSRTFYYSFTNANLATLDQHKWIGLENYFYLLQDPDWWKSLKNTILFTLCSVTLETALGFIFALVLNSKLTGTGLLRISVLVPWAIPAIVSAKIWAWMFNDLFGVINEVLIRSGLITEKIAWLADNRLSFAVLVFVDVWKTTPFMTLLILAGLQGVPKTVIEAAILDGANSFKRIFYVILPLIQPSLWVAIIFRTLDALRIFDLPYVLTSNSKQSAVVSVYVRQQLVDFQEIGYGSAASVVVFCMIGLFAFMYILMSKKSLGLD